MERTRRHRWSAHRRPPAGPRPMPSTQWHDAPATTEQSRGSSPPQWFTGLVRRQAGRRLLTLLAAVAGLVLIVAISGVRVGTQQLGTVGVVRNGGPFDDRQIRQVLMPGQRLTWLGWFSQTPHSSPAANVTRVYRFTSNAKGGPQAAGEVSPMPSKDGVQMQLDGAVYLRFVGERDIPTLKAFDMGPGTRQFPTP